MNSCRSICAAATASALASSATLVGSPCFVNRRAAVTPRFASRRRSSSSASPGLVSSQASSQPVAPSPSPCRSADVQLSVSRQTMAIHRCLLSKRLHNQLLVGGPADSWHGTGPDEKPILTLTPRKPARDSTC